MYGLKKYTEYKVCCSYLFLICCIIATWIIYFRFNVAIESVKYNYINDKLKYVHSFLCILGYMETCPRFATQKKLLKKQNCNLLFK